MLTPAFNRHRRAVGFTIVELLIVIVVIAILAAISIVAYTGIQERAKESAIRSDLSNFAKLVELYKVENGRYPHANIPSLEVLGFRATQSAYPNDPMYNYDYCTDGLIGGYTQYILYVIVSKDKSKGMYVSTNNTSPKAFTNNDVGDSSDSPCYNTHPSSAAVDAGLSGIVTGLSGVSPSNGWSEWVK